MVIILPAISKDLDIPETRQQWVISAYALTSGSFLLLFGKLADIYGKRMIFILGCFAMAAFALGAAFSTVEVCLYIMRALQGLVSPSELSPEYSRDRINSDAFRVLLWSSPLL